MVYCAPFCNPAVHHRNDEQTQQTRCHQPAVHGKGHRRAKAWINALAERNHCHAGPHSESGHHDRKETLATGIDDLNPATHAVTGPPRPETIPERQMIHWGNSGR